MAAAEIVDIAKAIAADLAATYEHEHIVERAYSTGGLWKFGEETEQESLATRLYVVPLSASREEHTHASELIRAEVHIAVCRKTASIDEQDEVISLAVEILKAKRRTTWTVDSGTARVIAADHLANPFPDWLNTHGVMVSIVRLTLTMEVDHG
jgi:hypothetical protein